MDYSRTLKADFEELVENVCQKMVGFRRGNSITSRKRYQSGQTLIERVLIERFSNTMMERTALQITFIKDGENVIVDGVATGFEGILFLRSPEGKQSYISKLDECLNEFETK